MKLGKVVVIVIFSLAMCWTMQRFINLSATAFVVAQVPISWTMLVFCGSLGLCAWLLGK